MFDSPKPGLVVSRGYVGAIQSYSLIAFGLAIRPGRLLLRTEQQCSAGAADSGCDDGDCDGQKQNVTGEDDPFGAGNDRRLKEGMYAVDECAGGSDAEGVKRRPCAALREQTQTDEKDQVGGESPYDGKPVRLKRRKQDGCAEQECGSGQDPR